MLISKASVELEAATLFDYILEINDLETALAEAVKLVSSFVFDKKSWELSIYIFGKNHI